MNKRIASAALAAASIASVVTVAGATPASAATPCGTYPPGNQYVLVTIPRSAIVADNATATVRGTLRRGGQACKGFRLGLYGRIVPSTASRYNLKGSGLTDSTGSVRVRLYVKKDTVFRTYYNLTISPGNNATGSRGQLYSKTYYCRYAQAGDSAC